MRNTIQLSQGQVELMVRNVIENALIPIFRRILRLSMRHMDRIQMIRIKDDFQTVDISRFDPFLVAEPTVGLGTASPEQKLGTLQFIYNEQKQYMQMMGMDNPFVGLAQIYNTLEDIVELGGVINAGRYFNHIDKEKEAIIGQAMAKQRAQQAEEQKAMQPMDPGRSLMMVESMKTRAKMQEVMLENRTEELKLQQRSLEKAEEFDIRRDELVQNRVISLAEIQQDAKNERIKAEQKANNPSERTGGQGTPQSGT